MSNITITRTPQGAIEIDNGTQADTVSSAAQIILTKKATSIGIRVLGGSTYTLTAADTITVNGAVVAFNAATLYALLKIEMYPPVATASGAITTANLVPAGAATAGSAVEIMLNGAGALLIQTVGTYTGNLNLQGTGDGVNWVTIGGPTAVQNANGTQGVFISSASQGLFLANVAGLLKARITGLGAMTGSVAVTLRAVGTMPVSNLLKSEDQSANNADTGIMLMAVRRDVLTVSAGATGRFSEVVSDAVGSLQIRTYEKQARTYTVSAQIAPAATATDVLILPGNASNIVYVTKVIVSGKQTTAGQLEILLAIRSTANTGGTSAASTPIRHYQSDAAALSAPLAYSANPSGLGALVGYVRRAWLIMGSDALPGRPIIFDFGDKGRPLVLQGVATGLAINLAGQTIGAGASLDIMIEYFEA